MTFMTEKDKKLLYALTVVVILFVFLNYLIFPQLRRAEELDDKIKQAEFEQMQMQQSVLSMSGKDKTIRRQQERLAEASAAYYPEMASQEIDRKIGELLAKNGLTVLEMEIGMPQSPAKLEPYVSALDVGKTQTENDGKKTQTQTDPDQDAQLMAQARAKEPQNGIMAERAAEPENTVIYDAKVQVTAVGSGESCSAFLDMLAADCPAIRVAGYSFQPQPAGESLADRETDGAGEAKRLKLELEIYMYVD